MSRLALLLFLVPAVHAGEQDAAIAHPLRWSDPFGTPAGTRRSDCLPILTDVEEAWSVDLPGLAESPLVYWEREAFVACRSGLGYALVAIDVITGRITAAIDLPKDSPKPLPVAWDGRVWVRVGRLALAEYRRVGGKFDRVWTHEPAEASLSDPIVFENEIYAVADGNLVRLRPRRKSPLWTAGNGRLRGRPALRGNLVYALEETESITVHAFERRTGLPRGHSYAGAYANGKPAGDGRPLRIAVTEKTIFVRGRALLASEPLASSHAVLAYAEVDGEIEFPGDLGMMKLLAEPAATPLGPLLLAESDGSAWGLLEADGRCLLLATPKDNPDLFHPAVRVAPTVLGDIVYFGTWAADIRTRQVLWRLPVKELHHPAVPLDRMVMVIDQNRRVRAFRPRRSAP